MIVRKRDDGTLEVTCRCGRQMRVHPEVSYLVCQCGERLWRGKAQKPGDARRKKPRRPTSKDS